MERPLILVVDDDRDARAVVVEILCDEGYEVVAVGGGSVALSALRAGLRPSVMLLDRIMPPPDGEDVLIMMRADPLLADIPIVWMTADLRPPPIPLAASLQKPFSARRPPRGRGASLWSEDA